MLLSHSFCHRPLFLCIISVFLFAATTAAATVSASAAFIIIGGDGGGGNSGNVVDIVSFACFTLAGSLYDFRYRISNGFQLIK